MYTSLDVLVWIVSGTASLSILAIFWSWASGRLNKAELPRSRGGSPSPPRYDPGD